MNVAKQPVLCEDVIYLSENVPVNANLYRPVQAEGSLPALVFCSGFLRHIIPYEFLAKTLAAAGYIVLTIAYRGMSFDYDDTDAMSAIDFLVSMPFVDQNRIGLGGHSRGGMCSLRTATKDPRVKCVVALAPPTELVRYYQIMKDYSPDFYQILTGGATLEEIEEYNRRNSALYYADRINVPVYLIAGTFDLIAPPQQSRLVYEAMVKSGKKNVKFEILPVGHFWENLYFGYQFEQVAHLVQSWLDKTLLSAKSG